MSSKWSERELGRLRMILEREYSDSIWEMARTAHQKVKNRSVNAISHKLRELIAERDFDADYLEVGGVEYPAQIVSGYVVLDLPNGVKKPAHHFVWELHYGVVIPEGYHVHHINGDRIDNRVINLALMSAPEHIKLHMAGAQPETFMLFCFLQEKNLWSEYLSYREGVQDLAKSLGTKKP